jgi:predicted nucleic acid-binding Zn ribbon protein
MIKKIGDILREYLMDRGWDAEDPASAAFLRWQRIAGDEIAAHSHPIELEKGVLIVEADHPGWIQTIGLRKTELLAALKMAAPEAGIADIRVRLARSGAPGRGSPRSMGP